MANNIIQTKSKKWVNKLILFFVFSLSILFLPINKKAQAWDAIAAASWQMGMEEIKENMKKTMLATMKVEAGIFISQEMDNAISMVTGEKGMMGLVNGLVDDWEAFLIEQPGNEAVMFLQEFLFKATGGRTSSAYIPKAKRPKHRYSSLTDEGFNSETIHYGLIKTTKAAEDGSLTANVSGTSVYEYDDAGARYKRELKWMNQDIAEMKKAEWSVAGVEPDYQKNPRLMYAKDNLRDMDIYFSGINNPWSYQQYKSMKMEDNYQRKRAELSLRALIGQGYVMKHVRDAVNKATMDNYNSTWLEDAIMKSDSYPEIVTYTALLKVTGVLKQSVRNVRKSYQKDLAVYRDQIMTSIQNALAPLGPEQVFEKHLQNMQVKEAKFGTGYQYENIDVEAQKDRLEAQQKKTIIPGQEPSIQ